MKINKLGNILLIIFVLLLIINVVSAEDNSVVEADNGKLMINGVSDSSLSIDKGAKLGATDSQQTLQAGEVGNYTELQSLVDSNYGGVLILNKDYAYSSSDLIKNITISNSITIIGNGHTISGENQAMAFHIPSASKVTLKNITFVNGKDNSMVWIKGKLCSIENCTFKNYTGSTYGPLRIDGPGNKVINSIFRDNNANWGGAVWLNSYYNYIINCTFENNGANNNYGGAIYLNGYYNYIYNSTFKKNKNAFRGGAIYIAKYHNLIQNCTFMDNDASSDYGYNPASGGAIFSYHQETTINNCTFVNNHASVAGAVHMDYANGVINNSIFNNNSASMASAVYFSEDASNNIVNNSKFNKNFLTTSQDGCALYVSGHNVKILNSEFNKHVAKDGGAVYWLGSNGTVKGSTFNENNATSFGGAIYWIGENGTIEDNEFNKNHAIQGGAIYVLKPNLLINDSRFSENTADQFAGAIYVGSNNTTVNNSEFRKNTAAERSGAIEIHGVNNTIEDSIFEDNSAENGGAIGIAEIDKIDENLNNTILDSRFNKNKAEHDGGAVLIASKGNTIDGSKFYYNTAANFAGAIKINAKSEFNVINNSYFEHNSAFQGGSIYVYPSNISINNTQMWSNNATEGGALFVFVGENVTVNNSVFGQNSASKNGGAAFWLGANGTVDNTHFYNNGVNAKNEKNVYGGAVYWIGNNAKINNSKFTYNSIRNNGNFSDGGALSIHDDYAIVENCLFEDNSADVNGGAINWAGDHGSIINSVFNRNTANVEGGAVNGIGKNLLINGSNFTKNRVTAQVGGALALDAFGTIDNSTFIENSAHKGGAIHWIDEGACLVNNSYFYKNHAYYAGGAISCDFFYYHADKYIQNTRFINNTCQNYGGAIASLDTEIDNCTFINNSANMGGAIHSYDSKINGSHFSDNSAKYGNDIYHSGTLDLIDLEVPDKNIVYVPSDLAEIVRYNIGNSTRLMNNSYIGMCFERWSLLPKYGAYDESLQGLINVISKESIVEYLKLLIYESFNSMEEVYPHEDDNYVLYPEGYEDYPDLIKDDKSNWVPISRTDYYSRAVHIFSDYDFRKSKHPVVQKILKLYDNGVRISQDQTKMVNGTMIKYHFSTLMSPASQSLFLFLITPIPKIDKTYLNTTDFITVNDTVAFNITVNNTGDKPLVNITIKEIYNSTELEYIGHSDNKTWIKNNDTFTFYHDPDVGDIVIYNIYLENTCGKNLENTVFGNVYNPSQLEFVKCANADLIKNPDGTFLFIDEIKAHKSKTLSLYFKILNKNVDLDAMNPKIIKYSFSEDNNLLSQEGNIKINRIYNDTFNDTNGNDFIVYDICLNNTCDSPLENITFNKVYDLTELEFINCTNVNLTKSAEGTFFYSGVIKAHENVTSRLCFKVLNNNIDKTNRTLNVVKYYRIDSNLISQDGRMSIEREYVGRFSPINVGEAYTFTIWFKTLTNGTLVNNISLNAHALREVLNATNKTIVYKPNMTVEKIALNKTVYLGNQTSFNIVVRNTGDCDLGNVTVVEKSYTGLVFDSYVNGTGNWKRVGDKFVLDGVLAKGASASFRVIFNTTVSGNFTNVVVANSNVTENKTTENKTEVVPIRVNVTKVWNDNNNQDGMRPENVTIILLADGKKIDEIVLSDKNNWNHIFVELPMVKDGKVINYTVSEIPIENYTMNIINKTVDDFTVIIANNTYNFDVVNTHNPLRTSVNVTKVWMDDGNRDGFRTEITVKLYDNNVFNQSFVLNEANNWRHTFDGLFEEGVNANKYNVVITNDIMYNFTITNTHIPERTFVNVTKVWDDDNNRDGVRPVSVVVELYADGKLNASYTLTAADGWKHTFENLYVYNNTKKIEYSIREIVNNGNYSGVVSNSTPYNFTVVNTHVPAVTSVNVTKVWDDDSNRDGVRPVSVVVVLVGNTHLLTCLYIKTVKRLSITLVRK